MQTHFFAVSKYELASCVFYHIVFHAHIFSKWLALWSTVVSSPNSGLLIRLPPFVYFPRKTTSLGKPSCLLSRSKVRQQWAPRVIGHARVTTTIMSRCVSRVETLHKWFKAYDYSADKNKNARTTASKHETVYLAAVWHVRKRPDLLIVILLIIIKTSS